MDQIQRIKLALESFLKGDRVAINILMDEVRRRYQPSVFFSRYAGESSALYPNTKEYALLRYMDCPTAQMVPYTYRCDPKTLLGTSGEAMKIEKFRPLVLQPYFQITDCDPANDEAMMAELQTWIAAGGQAFDTSGRGGVGRTVWSRLLNYIMMKMDMMDDALSWTIEEQHRQFFLFGQANFSGPTIKADDRLLKLPRAAELTANLPAGQEWEDTSVDAIGHIHRFQYMISQKSQRNATVTARYWTRSAWEAFRKNDEFKAPNGSDSKFTNRVRIDLTPTPQREPGVYEIGGLNLNDGVTDYLIDEYRKKIRYDRNPDGTLALDANGNPVAKEVTEQTLPEGAVFFIAENDHLPMFIYALIEDLGEMPQSGDLMQNATYQSLRRFPTRWSEKKNGKTCWGFGNETAPLAAHARPNTMGMLMPLAGKQLPASLGVTTTELDLSGV